jgi:hypothetical protein
LWCAIADACKWRASRTGPETAKGAMSTISIALPVGRLMNECSPGVISHVLGAASLNPAVVPTL